MKLEPTNKLTEATNATFPHPEKDTHLRWWLAAPERFYAPYVVEIVDRSNASLTFRFLNLMTNDTIGASHTIDLDDEKVVWRSLPSTVDVPNAKPGRCALLFLHSEELPKPLSDDAIASCRHPTTLKSLDTGKWPRAAPLVSTELLTMVKELKRDFITLEKDVLKPVDNNKAMSDRASKLDAFKGKLDGVARALGAM
ncbi:MAG: hypothetical protein MUF34_22405 [Polyangiaceae bacterium]|jgi:hypothetical protein|nr:hypothetical protein [Polyangiaceae bacterium]